MATFKQQKTAKALVDNLTAKGTKTAGQILEDVGYSKGIQENPQVVIRSDGVKEELYRMGFSEEKARQVVGEILQFGDEDRDRLKAAEMVFKVYGSYAPDKHINVNVKATPSERIKELAKKLNQ